MTEHEMTAPQQEPDEAAPAGAELRAPAGTRRRGFALVAAMLAIVVIGAIMVGGQTAASTETLVSESEQYGALALYAAERGMARAMATVKRATLDTFAIDGSATVLSQPTGTVQYDVSVRRLADDLYLFVSTGKMPRGNRPGATRTVAALTRMRNMDGNFDQAMMVFAGAELKGSVRVSGADSVPGNWTHCDSTDNKPGIVAKDTSRVDIIGAAQVDGDPAVQQEPSLTFDDFMIYGSLTFAELAAVARSSGKVYPAGASVTGAVADTIGKTTCVTTTLNNWGAPTLPTNACHYYFPMIYAEGNLAYGGNSIGQGILLVEGNLDLSGTAVFYGIVVVKGKLTVGSGNSRIIGTVMTANNGEMTNPSEVSGNPTIQYASCAVERAKKYNEYLGLATLVNGRAWMDFTNASGSY